MLTHCITSVRPAPAEGLEVTERRPSFFIRLTELVFRTAPHTGSRINGNARKIPTVEVIFKTCDPSRTCRDGETVSFIKSCIIHLGCLSCEHTLRINALAVHVPILGILWSLFRFWKPLQIWWPETPPRASIRLAILSVGLLSKPTKDKAHRSVKETC